jgi:CubicO group peptidase (beta-lactamase class C family)
MKTFLTIVFAFIGILIVAGVVLYIAMPKQAKAPDIQSVAELDAYFEKITGQNMPPALNVSVTKNGETVYSKGFGTIDSGATRPTVVDTIYPWWSVTKLFTAVAVLHLVEEGELDLDDSLAAYLPYYSVVDNSGEPVAITIRQIMNHSSGLRDLMPDGLNWIHLADQPPMNQTLFVQERLTGPYLELKFTPDTDVYYSNVGYVLLGAVIEKITGQSYESYIREIILDPLGMNETEFIRSKAQEQRTAGGSLPVLNIYSALMWKFGDDDFFDNYVDARVDGRLWLKPLYTDYTPSTGLSGTSKDLATFGQFLMTGVAANGARILQASTISEMQVQVPADEMVKQYKKVKHYGYGLKAWSIDGRRVHGHAGGGAGYGALLAFLPDDQLVVTVNANDASMNRDEMLRVLTSLSW